MPGKPRRILLFAAVVAVAAGCGGGEARKAPPQPVATPVQAATVEPLPRRTRYDCLIIRNTTGVDDVAASSGFPKYLSTDNLPALERAVAPTASMSAQLMGTQVSISVWDIDRAQGEAAITAALERIAELSKKLNIFDAASEVSVLNREAGKSPVKLDDDLARVVDGSLRVSRLSNGAFDATVGPLTDLWRTNRYAGKLPGDDEVTRCRERVGWDKVELSGDGTRFLKFAREGMSFDFGGIAKGFGSEEAAKVLARFGVRSAIIRCGGDIKLIGSRPGGRPFRVGVADPRPDAPQPERFILLLSDASVDTSGNYIQFTMIGGRRYSHIIDPRTGRSIEALPSVTVIGPDATLCDALATAISVLGETEGLKLIDRVNAEAGQ